MRITSNMSSNNSIYNLQKNLTKLDKLEELTASGQNVNRPSDDPTDTRFLLDIRDKLKVNDQYQTNIVKSTTWQKVTSTALTGMAKIMSMAKGQVTAIYSGTADADVLQNAALQLKTLKQQLIDLGNTQLGDQYVFGGANNATMPFKNVVSPPALSTDYYTGDETAINVEIEKNTTQQMNIPGNQLLTADSAASQPYGSTNIFKAFDDLITAVQANDVAGIQSGALALENGSKQISYAQTDVALRKNRLDFVSNLNESTKNTLEAIYGDTQNVDYAKLSAVLNQQKIAYEASLSTTAKVSQLSLLNYL